MKLLRSLVFASIFAFAGCATQSKPVLPEPTKPVASAPQKSVPNDPSLVKGGTWTLNLALPHMWDVSLLNKDLGDVKLELVAMTKDETGVDARLTVVSGATKGLDEVAFIKAILDTEAKSEDTKVLQVFKAKLKSGETAAGVIKLKLTDDGHVMFFQIVTSKNGRGFIVKCGGDPKTLHSWQALCAETLETFKFSGVGAQQKQNVDEETTETTQVSQKL